MDGISSEDALADCSTASVLKNFLEALHILGRVYNCETEFSQALMPASTEKFLIECGERLAMIEQALGVQ